MGSLRWWAHQHEGRVLARRLVCCIFVQVIAPELVTEGSTLLARAAYVTFNGGSNINMPASYVKARQPSVSSPGDAFGRLLLASCGVALSLAMKLDFAQSITLYRQMLKLSLEQGRGG